MVSIRKKNEDGAAAVVAANPEVEKTALQTVYANCDKVEESAGMEELDWQEEMETETTVTEKAEETEATVDEEEAEEVTETESTEEVAADKFANYAPRKIGDNSKKILNAKAVAEKYGAVFVNDNTAYIGTGSMLGNKIKVELLYERKNAQRVYQITEETYDGEVRGKYSKKSIFSCGEIVAKSRRIELYISAFVDDYTIDINNITLILQIIENNRLLRVTKRGTVDMEILTTDQILKRLVQYMKNCISDERLAVIEMNGEIRAGIVGRGTKTTYQNFRSLINELAPENDVKVFKDDIYNKNLLIHDNSTDCNDSGLTVSSKWIKELGIRGDKMYAFRFSENELKEIKEAYVEFYSKSKELKAGESNGVS